MEITDDLCRAILVRALRDLRNEDDEIVKDALDWLLDEPNTFRDNIVDLTTNLHQDDIKRAVREAFLEDD